MALLLQAGLAFTQVCFQGLLPPIRIGQLQIVVSGLLEYLVGVSKLEYLLDVQLRYVAELGLGLISLRVVDFQQRLPELIPGKRLLLLKRVEVQVIVSLEEQVGIEGEVHHRLKLGQEAIVGRQALLVPGVPQLSSGLIAKLP